jgi:hypothetical protein
MKKAGTISKKDPFVIWMLLGIPVLFIVASPLHFLFDWSGKNMIAGLFTPVNESPWEHLKLTFWPILVWWTLGYLLFSRRKERVFGRYAVSCAVSAFVSTVFVAAFFYTYTGALGVESLIVDIISLFLGLFLSIILAQHVYKRTKPGLFAAFIAVVIIMIMAAAFLFFTFTPPHLPIFKDPPTGTYGI